MSPARMTGDSYRQGLLDTNILILRRRTDLALLARFSRAFHLVRRVSSVDWPPRDAGKLAAGQLGSAIGAGCPQL